MIAEGKKDDTGKLRYDLLDPDFMAEMAKNMTVGANRYGDRNWEAGMKWGRIFRALLSHAWRFWRGEIYDEDGWHHMAAVAFCAQALFIYSTRKIGEDDRAIWNRKADRNEPADGPLSEGGAQAPGRG